MRSVRCYTVIPVIVFSTLVVACSLIMADEPKNILERMEIAYGEIRDYQTLVELRNYSEDGSFEVEEFLYTLKKPHWIRLDFKSPHSGMVIVYPDSRGRVVVRPSGFFHFLKFYLSPDDSRLVSRTGQRIDETDMGLLIENIRHSVTDHRRGPVDLVSEDRRLIIRVLADDHFRKGVETRYAFTIDKDRWLPIGVSESTPEGRLERTIFFRDLRTNLTTPDSFFQMDGP